MNHLPLTFRLLLLASICAPLSPALDLSLGPADFRIERDGQGYLLHVRKKPDIASILITEAPETVAKGGTVYSLRDSAYHNTNGDEKRVLNGAFLDPNRVRSLIDSTAGPGDAFPEEFTIFLPPVVLFGYAPGRHGELEVRDGTRLNLRAFSKPYADYSGVFKDNPLTVPDVPVQAAGGRPATDASGAPAAVETAGAPGAVEAVDPPRSDDTTKVAAPLVSPWPAELQLAGHGRVVTDAAASPASQVAALIESSEAGPLDVVLCIDTTASMDKELVALQDGLPAVLEAAARSRHGLRVGVVYFRDYMEEYLTRSVPLASQLGAAERSLVMARSAGGRPAESAVYEALWTAVTGFGWNSESAKVIILIGKNRPHRSGLGSISGDAVYQAAQAAGIALDAVIPQDRQVIPRPDSEAAAAAR